MFFKETEDETSPFSGVALLIGGVAMGYLYEYSFSFLIGYKVVIELLAFIAFVAFKKNI